MTPLARQILDRQTLPLKRRPRFFDEGKILPILSGFHTFDTTEIEPLRFEVSNQIARMRKATNHPEIERLVFLPAPRTWLEKFIFGKRYAYALVEWNDERGFDLFLAYSHYTRKLGSVLKSDPFGILPAYELTAADFDPESGNNYLASHLADAIGQLVLINSPHIIGRHQHMPSWSLERKLSARMVGGKFPLQAWTEIKLNVAKPVEIDDGEVHEAHLTGKRALHFCRAHVRIKNGRLEYVRSHWRGDPSIGIKQSRYVVQP